MAISANVLLYVLINLFYHTFTLTIVFTYTELLIYSILAFVFLFLLRLTVKTLYDFMTQRGDIIIPVMIFGTKSAAIGIAKMLMSEQVGSKYELVGFIDDDKNASEKMIMGVRVYHLKDDIVKTVIKKKAKAIIISPLKLNQVNSMNILEKL